MTGNIQKMAEAVWNQFTKKGGLKPKEQRAALLLVCTWVCFVLGGVCGASLAEKSNWSLAPAASIYFFGMLSMQIELPKAPVTAKPVEAGTAGTAAESNKVDQTASSTKSAPPPELAVTIDLATPPTPTQSDVTK